MRKIIFLTLLLCFIGAIAPRLQTQTIKNKAIMQARELGDTLIARINNKLYYTVKTNNKWNIENASIAFHPFTLSDTTPDVILTYATDKAALVKR